MKKIWIPLVALLLFLAACTNDTEETGEQEEIVTPVEVGQVTQGDVSVEKRLYGRATPKQTTPVMTPMAGEVDTIEVANGDEVEEDDVILTIIAAQTGREIEITAPADGIVTNMEASEGGMISNSDPVAIIAKLDELSLQVDVTANDLNLFEKDQEVDVNFSGDEKTSTATVDYVSSLPNNTGLYPVKLTVDNPDYQWKAGMVAVLTLSEKTIEDTLVIPTTALIEEEEESFVYVVEDNDTVSKTTVTVIETQSDVTAIEAELEEGDRVVTSGQLTLSDGSKVSVNEEGSES
ncbi:hypothetical protein GCM10011351_18090 [Paraliobacillus quinghaiensis]|uniref:Efflux RND transporter periplasmic adaptor subunit n=1 Tax=Paraliobacillus quinghaiensis TaxID=470815 RepID=A0A917TPU4_9BACI|nr:efflux RND transporter periplasmic adaptor subunit [Paraliobacillus quinghaiensis]GGM32376.1 hypothetical protein GCM10011351_18090 [Paraliobacillus quinghaiensis]